MRGDRKCVICGDKYNYCPVCGRDDATLTWKFIYCSENCRQLFNIASEWASGKLSTNDAKIKLDEINIPSLNNLNPSIRKNIGEIYSNNI